MSGTRVESEVDVSAVAPRPGSRGVVLARLRDLALVPAIIAIAVVGYAVNPVFLSSDNLINILQTMSEIGLLVLAQTLVLVAGKMDLSLESTFGLAPGERVRVVSRRGQVEAPIRIDESLRPGLTFMTLHFQDDVATNLLTIDATDPKSGTAEFKATAIRIEKLEAPVGV